MESLSVTIDCPPNPPVGRGKLEIWASTETASTLIASLESRCGVGGTGDQVNLTSSDISFDEERGYLYFNIASTCDPEPDCVLYEDAEWVARIEGFTTTFEILQTYTPTANEISFRVPYMPEGFQHADHFDTYWGDLSTAGDWRKAQPLQCGYPATAPVVGDYLTVEDTLPPLDPGQGRYYVTAVTHQGETRYGRKSSGEVLTGRDPTVLPGCGE
jgi:hypothetical protein